MGLLGIIDSRRHRSKLPNERPQPEREDGPRCAKCGDTGTVRVHGAEDYGASFESEHCEAEGCLAGQLLIATDERDEARAKVERLGRKLDETQQRAIETAIENIRLRASKPLSTDVLRNLDLDALRDIDSRVDDLLAPMESGGYSHTRATLLALADYADEHSSPSRREPGVECPRCEGSGKIPWGSFAPCVACKGLRRVTREEALLIRVVMTMPPVTHEVTSFPTPDRVALAADLESWVAGPRLSVGTQPVRVTFGPEFNAAHYHCPCGHESIAPCDDCDHEAHPWECPECLVTRPVKKDGEPPAEWFDGSLDAHGRSVT